MPELSATQQIQSLYVSLLNRPADPEGLEYWTNELLVKHAPASVISAILNSQEYAQRELQPTPPQVIESVYLNLFGRLPDDEGRDYYLKKMQQQKQEEVINQIIENAAGVDAANKQQKVEVAEKMSQQLKEQQQQLQQEQAQNQIKAAHEAMQRMKELLKQTNEQNKPTPEEINEIVKEANESIKPDPITIEVPGPTKIIEVPGTVGITLGDGQDTINLGEVAASITVEVNDGLFNNDGLIVESNLDTISGFSANDKLNLALTPGDYEFIALEVDSLGEAVDEGYTDATLLFAYTADGETSWLIGFDDAGDPINAVELVGLGDGDFTSSNFITTL